MGRFEAKREEAKEDMSRGIPPAQLSTSAMIAGPGIGGQAPFSFCQRKLEAIRGRLHHQHIDPASRGLAVPAVNRSFNGSM